MWPQEYGESINRLVDVSEDSSYYFDDDDEDDDTYSEKYRLMAIHLGIFGRIRPSQYLAEPRTRHLARDFGQYFMNAYKRSKIIYKYYTHCQNMLSLWIIVNKIKYGWIWEGRDIASFMAIHAILTDSK